MDHIEHKSAAYDRLIEFTEGVYHCLEELTLLGDSEIPWWKLLNLALRNLARVSLLPRN
jgi:hypothetical protein